MAVNIKSVSFVWQRKREIIVINDGNLPRLDKFKNEAGSVPVNKFSSIRKSPSLTKFPIDSEIVPVN